MHSLPQVNEDQDLTLQDISNLPADMTRKIMSYLDKELCAGEVVLKNELRFPILLHSQDESIPFTFYKGVSSCRFHGRLDHSHLSKLCKQSGESLQALLFLGGRHERACLHPLEIFRTAPFCQNVQDIELGSDIFIDEVAICAMVSAWPRLRRFVIRSDTLLSDATLTLMSQKFEMIETLGLECDMRACSETVLSNLLLEVRGTLKNFSIRAAIGSFAVSSDAMEDYLSGEFVRTHCAMLQCFEVVGYLHDRCWFSEDQRNGGLGTLQTGPMQQPRFFNSSHLRTLSLVLRENEDGLEMNNILAVLLAENGQQLTSLCILFEDTLVRNHANVMQQIGKCCPSLTSIELSKVTIDDDLVRLLCQYGSNLAVLRLWDCDGHLSNDSVSKLRTYLTRLQVLSLDSIWLDVGAVIELLSSNAKTLRKLYVRNCTAVPYCGLHPTFLSHSINLCPNIMSLNVDVHDIVSELRICSSQFCTSPKYAVLRMNGGVCVEALERLLWQMVNLERIRVEIDHDDLSLRELDDQLSHPKILALPGRHVLVEYVRMDAPTYCPAVLRRNQQKHT